MVIASLTYGSACDCRGVSFHSRWESLGKDTSGCFFAKLGWLGSGVTSCDLGIRVFCFYVGRPIATTVCKWRGTSVQEARPATPDDHNAVDHVRDAKQIPIIAFQYRYVEVMDG